MGRDVQPEAAGVAALYALVLGCAVYREISPGKLWKILRDTVRDTAEVTGFTRNPLMILLIINLVLLIIGCFMETIAAMNILVPVLAP